MNLIELPSGLRFGLSKEKPPSPAPTLFIFAQSIEANLSKDEFFEVGRIVEQRGYICASLDVPCHGSDKREGEPVGLDGWRFRIENGENPFERFASQSSQVLDYLIEQEYSDPANIAVCGSSRGGFAAAHFAAKDQRVRSIIAMSPVTKLSALREFNGLEDHALTNSTSLIHLSEELAGRSLWLIIGNRDSRVSTDFSVEFAESVVQTSSKTTQDTNLIDVSLQVLPSLGHHCPDRTHEMAAEWLLKRTV